MILRNQVEWALHCCSVLASQERQRFVPAKDLADFHGVPKEYLAKALQALSTAGILEGSLGPQGGYRLGRPAGEISFLQIVEAVEGRQNTFSCSNIKDQNPCQKKSKGPSSLCGIARVMYQADEAWRRELQAMSVAQFAESLRVDLGAATLARNEGWFLQRAGLA